MTMGMAIYATAGVVMFGAIILVAFAVWSKKQEMPEFSFLRHIRTMRGTKPDRRQRIPSIFLPS